MLQRRMTPDDVEHLGAPLARVRRLRVDDGESRTRGKGVAESRQDDVRPHPVQARADGDEAIGRRKRSVLRTTHDPADPRVVTSRQRSPTSDHRGGRIDGIDTLDGWREVARERARSRAGIEDDARFDDEPLEDREDALWIRRAVFVERRDLIVGEDAPELDGIHPIASSRRSRAAPTLASRLPARSNVQRYFFTTLCLSLSTATYVRPTGFPGVAPPGPEIPVMPRPIFAPRRVRAPRASAPATTDDTAPCEWRSCGVTSARISLASLL